MHPEGQWLALEHMGEPVSVFYQRRWEKQRAVPGPRKHIEDLEKNLPEWYTPKSAAHIFICLESGRRWSVRAFLVPMVSIMLARSFMAIHFVGFEGKQVNRNVVATSVNTIRHVEKQ